MNIIVFTIKIILQLQFMINVLFQDNSLVLVSNKLLLFSTLGLLNPVQDLLAKENQEDNDWSMIMEVEVEDPTYNSSSDKTDEKNIIINGKKNQHFLQKNNETVTEHGTSQHSILIPGATICGSFLCYNQGQCYTNLHSPSSKCLCPLGYSGDFCDKGK